MASKKSSSSQSEKKTHPGSSVEDTKAVGGKGDFGVPESDVVGRTYTSTNTKRSDPGNAPARGGDDASRTTGVGGNASGDGSSSGGDIDTDIVGVGSGGSGLAASGIIHEPDGADAAQVLSSRTADPRTRGVYQASASGQFKGTTVQRGDEQTGAGADAAGNPDMDDDSFAGEVSTDEASGRNDAL